MEVFFEQLGVAADRRQRRLELVEEHRQHVPFAGGVLLQPAGDLVEIAGQLAELRARGEAGDPRPRGQVALQDAADRLAQADERAADARQKNRQQDASGEQGARQEGPGRVELRPAPGQQAGGRAEKGGQRPGEQQGLPTDALHLTAAFMTPLYPSPRMVEISKSSRPANRLRSRLMWTSTVRGLVLVSVPHSSSISSCRVKMRPG